MRPLAFVYAEQIGCQSQPIDESETQYDFWRYEIMEPSSETQIRLRIATALGDRLSTLAVAIVSNITSSTRLIEELPSAAIEAMLTYSRERHQLHQPKNDLDRAYKDVRAALLAYGEVALREAHKRERQLFQGITGLAPEEDMR